MLTRRVLGLMVLVAPLVSSGLARAGWGWENLLNSGPKSTSRGSAAGDKAVEAASRAVRDGRDADALNLLRVASSTRPWWSPIRLELARLQFAANQAAKGRQSLEQAAVEFPNDPRVYLMFGHLGLDEGRRSDAQLNGEKALSLLEGTKLDAESVRGVRREAHAMIAAVAEGRNDWASARTHLVGWLDVDPRNAAARQRLGRALFQLGKPEAAFQELTRSAQDDPKLGPAAVPMALLYAQAGNDPKAEEWFLHGSRADPKGAVPRLMHARWRLDKGRADEARTLAEEAARLDPKSKEIQPLRGLIAWQLRELAAAERIFEGLHREAPDDAGFVSLLTLALVEQDDPEKRSRGIELAEAGVRKFPTAVDVLASAARAHARSGHRDEAERLLRAAIARTGGRATPTIAYFLAQLLAEKGLADDARGLLTQATATPIAFAYQADAKTLLASLPAKTPARPGSAPTTDRVEAKKP